MNDVNREVAEKVMGAPNPYPKWFLRGADWYMLPEDVPAYWECYFYFDPMHRIEHAWMVLEKFAEWRVWKANKRYACCIGAGFMTQTADTAQEAICRAALAAKEGEND